MIGSVVGLFTHHSLAQEAMGAAIGFAAIIIVLGIFLPSVLHGLEKFLLTFLDRATAVVESISPEQAARVFHTTR